MWQIMCMKDSLIEVEWVKAIQEQLCGFLLDQVIDPTSEFFDDGEFYRPGNAVEGDDEAF